MRGREVEMTFDIDLAELERVYRAFSLPVAEGHGRSCRVSLMPPRTALHFYLPPGPGEQVRRLRVRRSRDQYVISLESKQVIREDPMLVEKEETVLAPRLPLERAREMMSESVPVVSSFIKNQHRVTLKSNSSALKVSLDHMIPFLADQPTILGPETWHLEIEEIQGWPISEFLESNFFRQHMSALRPLQKSKWELARMSSPVALKTASACHFRDYLAILFREGEKQIYPLSAHTAR
jgi:hypothetical protein